jgi:diguanylate cyclase (GGDEF)-like protein/PAS domain S-box-containing protein
MGSGHSVPAAGEDSHALIAAIAKSQAMIEFALDGTILWANERFLSAMGYRLAEIRGRHHSIFVEPGYAQSVAYQSFWQALRQGQYHVAEFKRVAKGGRAVWLQASYNPVLDNAGKPVKILKFATDVTARRQRSDEFRNQAAALAKSQAMVELALDGTILTANACFLRIMGYTLGEIRGRHHSIFVEPALRNSTEYEEFWAQLRQGRFQAAEFRRVAKEGREVWLQATYNPILDAEGRPVKIVKLATDVTARKRQADEYMRQVEAIGKSQAVAEFALDGTILNANARFLKATGYRLEEIAGRNHSIFVDPAYRYSSEYRRFWSDLRRGRYHAAEYRRVGKNGQAVWFQASYNPVFDDHGKPVKVLKFATDVTAWKLKAATAEVDFLTGLPNRMLLQDRLRQAIVTAKRHKSQLALLFLDLDGFKHVNDSLGHLIGDKLLQSVAQRLVNCVRASDTVSRQGGDEFVLLLCDLREPQDAAVTAQKLLNTVADPHLIDQHQLYVTTSVGVAVFPQDGEEAGTLIKNADTAMYQAKQKGRNAYSFFKAEMNARAQERQFISEHLRYAVDRHELTLLYQPKIDIASREIVGAEALLRWTSKERGAVPPATFIPVAEDCGMIRQISAWVLREACVQARAWQLAGVAAGRVAVNISGVEFRNDDFLRRVLKIFEETQVDPNMLELELTESVLMKNADLIAPVLHKLREIGVRVSIDDFGTGYSSLSYLTKFPIDALKIDKSFIQHLGEPGQDAVIVSAIISMARSLNLKAVAEGVETGAHLEMLRSYACDEAQGYYFSHPVAAGAFAELVD